jgi:hypothetical protein
MALIRGEVPRRSVNLNTAAKYERLELSRLHGLQQVNSALYLSVSFSIDSPTVLSPAKWKGIHIVGSERTSEQLGITHIVSDKRHCLPSNLRQVLI